MSNFVLFLMNTVNFHRVTPSRKYSRSKTQSKNSIMELTVSEYKRLALLLICLHFKFFDFNILVAPFI